MLPMVTDIVNLCTMLWLGSSLAVRSGDTGRYHILVHVYQGLITYVFMSFICYPAGCRYVHPFDDPIVW